MTDRWLVTVHCSTPHKSWVSRVVSTGQPSMEELERIKATVQALDQASEATYTVRQLMEHEHPEFDGLFAAKKSDWT